MEIVNCFDTFALMKNAIKQSSLIFTTICLIIILADFGLIHCAVSHTHQSAQIECDDAHSHCKSAHPHGMDHETLLNFVTLVTVQTGFKFDKSTQPEPAIFNNYVTSIWQPPRHS